MKNFENLTNKISLGDLCPKEQAEEIAKYIMQHPHKGIDYPGADAGVFKNINNMTDFINSLKGENAFFGLSPESQEILRNPQNTQSIINAIHEHGFDKGFLKDFITPDQVIQTNATEALPQITETISQDQIAQLFPELGEFVKQWGPLLVAAFLGSSYLLLLYMERKLKKGSASAKEGDKESISEEALKESCYKDIVNALEDSLMRAVDRIDERGLTFAHVSDPKTCIDYYNVNRNRPRYAPPKSFIEAAEEADSRRVSIQPRLKQEANCKIIDNTNNYIKTLSRVFKTLNINSGFKDNYITLGENDYPIVWLIGLEMDRLLQTCRRDIRYGHIKNMKYMIDKYLEEGVGKDSEKIARNIIDVVPLYSEKGINQKGKKYYEEFSEIEKKEFFDLIYIIDAILLISYADTVSSLSDKEVKELLHSLRF